MSNVDTPDYQLGVTSAQVKLAHVPAGTSSVTVGVSPNAESLVVMAPASMGCLPLFVTGVTTSMYYSGAAMTYNGPIETTDTYLLDITSVLDQQVTISFQGGTPAFDWYVYADAASHISIDPTKLTNRTGVQYVIASAPSTAADHPPFELQNVSGQQGSGNCLGPPGVGLRYRLFYACIAPVTAGAGTALTDTGSGVQLINNPTNYPFTVDYKPSGLPLSGNRAVTVTSTAGNISFAVVYTVETV